jgi:hypothetical protein
LKSGSKFLFVLFALVLLFTTSAYAQFYAYPKKGSDGECTTCLAPNTKLPTYPFDDPIVAHVGRYVDSSTTLNYQNSGIRSVRATDIRYVPATKRLYIGLGEAVGSYTLDNFLTRIKAPLSNVNVLGTGQFRGTKDDRYGNPYEKVAAPDSILYPESKNSGWKTEQIDSQVNLNDFDADDRGYVYLANLYFGWGIGRDVGVTGASHMQFVAQTRTESYKMVQDPDDPSKLIKVDIIPNNSDVRPDRIMSFKIGSKYYVVLSDNKNDKQITWDVTNPNAPVKGPLREGRRFGIVDWSKYEDTQRVAVIADDKRVLIYDYESYVDGGEPIAALNPGTGKEFEDISFDDQGRLWIAESSYRTSNVLRRLSPSGNGYVAESFDVYGSQFSPEFIHAGSGYIAVAGRAFAGSSYQAEVRILKVDGGIPHLLDIDNFFRKFYHDAPAGYADPSKNTPSYVGPRDVRFLEAGGKTYLLYSAGGLGDVYEIQGGEALTATIVGSTFGTANPNARSTEAGPFYGDPIRFKAVSNSDTANYGVDWNFDNVEAGTGALASSDLGDEVEYQYFGLNTAQKITAARTVVASASTDSSLTDSVVVNMKVPKARIGMQGLSSAIIDNTKTIVVVPGDKLTDASDGSVEGHYAIWDVDGTKTALAPNTALTIGPALGEHTISLTSTYGAYESNSMPTSVSATQRFQSSVNNVKFDTVPFVVSINAPTSTATQFKFNGTARVASDRSILTGTQWTVTWTLTGPGATALAAAQQATTVNIGTIPEFAVAKNDLNAANGGKVTLTVSVAPTQVPDETFASADAAYAVQTPNPKIDLTGCAHVGEECKLTVGSLTPTTANVDSWNLSWSVKLGSNVVKSGTGKQIVFTPATAGSYTATVTETVFDVSASKPFTVAPPACGALPELHMINLGTECSGNCTAGTPVSFYINMFGYTPQACDTYTWTFGENNATGTGLEPKYTYTKNGTFHVTMKVTNTTNTSGRTWTMDVTVGNGQQPPPPPPPCSAPVGISFSWLGSKGCKPGTACEVNENVKFTAKRPGDAALLSCDTAQWNVGGTTYSTKTASHAFTSTGNKTVTVVITNTEGSSDLVQQVVEVKPASGPPPACNSSIAPGQLLGIEYEGKTSGCASGSSKPCQANEDIVFNASIFGYQLQTCDVFQWVFDDNTANSADREPTHKFGGQKTAYNVSLKIFNTNAPNGVSVSVVVPFSNVPAKPLPQLTRDSWPSKGTKGSPVTFNVTSDIAATGWLWEFDGITDNSQANKPGTSNSIQHVFTTSGSHSVKVSARNAEDSSTAPTNFVLASITIEDTPEYRYLVPAVTHAGGLGGSVWRTDVQIYNPDPNVSPQNPLVMTATMRNITRTIEIFDSTYIFEDFMQRFTNVDDGPVPVIITTKSKYAPQIWTRTYNQTESGTYGQFVPAIRLDDVGGGSAIGSGKYYLAGLRSNARYRTNIGFVNPTSTMVPVNVAVYDDRGIRVGQYSRQIQPFALLQEAIHSVVSNISPDRPFSIEVDVPAGQWMIAFASFIDNGSADPVYIQAVRASELSSADFRQGVLPGVGHIGAWRSDVSIFNPNSRTVTVDLSYHDTSGAKKGEALNVPIGAGEFLQYDDLLHQGVFGNVGDGLGMLRVTVPASVSADVFPMAFARTYNDAGVSKTYGQGIAGVAATRANVKPGTPALIAGIRSNTKYYTNLGMTNLTETPSAVTVRLLDPATGAEFASYQYALRAYESIVATNVDLKGREKASVKMEVTGGGIWGFASVIDRGTFDPEYVAATPLQQ